MDSTATAPKLKRFLTKQISETARLKLNEITLEGGGHGAGSKQFCAMEALAYVAGERHSDHPVCASDTIGYFMRASNDYMTDVERQKLKAVIPLVVGTRPTRQVVCQEWAQLYTGHDVLVPLIGEAPDDYSPAYKDAELRRKQVLDALAPEGYTTDAEKAKLVVQALAAIKVDPEAHEAWVEEQNGNYEYAPLSTHTTSEPKVAIAA